MADEAVLDRVFWALSDATRRGIIDQLGRGDASITSLADKFQMTLTGMKKHVQVLERAGLVIAQRSGRERWNHLDVVPIKLIHDRWIGDYARSSVELLTTLKAALEPSPT